MSLPVALICLLAALLAVGLGTMLATWTKAPGWLVQIVTLAMLLLMYAWLPTVLR